VNIGNMHKKGFTPHLWTYSKNNRKDEYDKGAGFTLVEVVISVCILALVTTGLAYVFFAGKKHVIHNRSKMQVAELGRLFLAPLQMDVRQDQWGSNCLGSGSGCPSTPTNDVSVDTISYKPTTVVSGVSGTSLKKIKVTINWTE